MLSASARKHVQAFASRSFATSEGRRFTIPKSTQLKNMLRSKELEFIMEAHNGLSAKIAEEAGFKGIWGSGLSISAQYGLRDNNEASWTQILDQIEFMEEGTSVPILLDGDTGYGNFNNARRLIQKLESRKIAGVCLEDKMFPKTNSFIDGEKQALAPIEEFCGKIQACKDTQKDPDFVVVARLEAFITGLGLDVALERAHAYAEAGADAILVHSKKKDDSDIEAFMKKWSPEICPVVIVPTKYWQVPTQKFRDMGVSMVIWANHNMRATIKAMQDTSRQIFQEQSLRSIEEDKKVVDVAEIFRLQNVNELKAAEKKYENYTLPSTRPVAGRPMDETVRDFLDVEYFKDQLSTHGTDFYTGVPDSLLANFCAYITDTVTPQNHIITANEGTAVATAVGHYLATNKIPLVYLQNSGLGNTVNPLLSLADPKVYGIPMLLMVGWRGQPGKRDEPQHGVQGLITRQMLKDLGIAHEVLPDYNDGITECLEHAYKYMHTKKAPFCLLVRRQTFHNYHIKTPPVELLDASGQPPALTREGVLGKLCDAYPSLPFVCTTGFASRELYEMRAARNQGHSHDFLTVGSMGHCSSISLGIAVAQPHRQVVCVDGDGAAIMHMGAMATIGQVKPSNLIHVVINNGMHDSVGGQPSAGAVADFVTIAKACGYPTAVSASTEAEVDKALTAAKEHGKSGPHFIEIRVAPGTRGNLGRPTSSPEENKVGFMKFLQQQ